MKSRRGRAGAFAVVATAALCAMTFSPLATPAGAVPVLPSTCRATLAKVTVAGTSVLDPLTVQNPPNQNCTTQGADLVSPIEIPGLLRVEVGFVKTSVKGMTTPPERPFHFPKAHARVAKVRIQIPLLADVTVEAIEALSKSRCHNGQPETLSRGEIVNLYGNLAGIPLGSPGPTSTKIITNEVPVNVPGIAKLVLNEQVSTATNQQRTAFVLEVPLLQIKVVISQVATALTGANPCVPA